MIALRESDELRLSTHGIESLLEIRLDGDLDLPILSRYRCRCIADGRIYEVTNYEILHSNREWDRENIFHLHIIRESIGGDLDIHIFPVILDRSYGDTIHILSNLGIYECWTHTILCKDIFLEREDELSWRVIR